MNPNHAITKLRNSLGLRMSYGLRAFVIYIFILGGLGWYLVGHAVERLTDGMRQAAENIMVDSANILAAMLEEQIGNGEALDTAMLAKIMQTAKQRVLLSKIYQVDKFSVDADIYVTNAKGVVIYDSTAKNLGKDFSNWRDVNLTLKGEYGARTSHTSQTTNADSKSNDAPKSMIVAAPIRKFDQIIGSVSLLIPINSLDRHLDTETRQMQNSMLMAIGLAVFLGFVLSILFSKSINKVANYANKLAHGENIEPPRLLDQRLADLSDSIANLRTQLDGKEYVEEYIHSLTHELKTPITGIQGAVELIAEGLPAKEQAKFLENIRSSNQRMARLVDRMLQLANLESQLSLVDRQAVNLNALVTPLLNERQQIINSKKLVLNFDSQRDLVIDGDPILLSQAIANLLDNAIRFADFGSTLSINCQSDAEQDELVVKNDGELIPEYALERIFERFFSLPSSAQLPNQKTNKSTGLGLSFIQEIMKLHDGKVKINNHQSGVVAKLIWPRH